MQITGHRQTIVNKENKDSINNNKSVLCPLF